MPTVAQTRQQLISDSRQVAVRVGRLVRWRGLLLWLSVTLAALITLLLVDCIFKREELGLRWLSLCVWLAVASAMAHRWLIPSVRFAARPEEIVRWLESHRPDLNGSLSTAIELAELDPSDERFGSRIFQDAALVHWEAQSHQLDWRDCVDSTSARRALLALLGVAIASLFYVGMWPTDSSRAFRRFLLPWVDNNWPRQDQLQLINLPTAIGTDAVVQVEVADAHPPLPVDVVVQWRYANSQAAPPMSIEAQTNGHVAVAELPPLSSDIQVRAIGGDDRQMPWQTIRVVAAPTWKSHQFRVQLPEYARTSTALKSRFPDAAAVQDNGSYSLIGPHIQVLQGSQLQFSGQLDRPVHSVEVQEFIQFGHVALDASAAAKEFSQFWRSQLDATCTNVVVGDSSGKPVAFDEPIAWTFRIGLDDETLFQTPQVWRVDVIEDQPPEASLASISLRSLAVGAPLQIVGQASDDWGLSEVKVKVSIPSMPELVLMLPIVFEGDTHELPIQARWDIQAAFLEQGHLLQPQDQIEFWIEARDLLGQLGSSSTEQLTIETGERQLELIAQRQSVVNKQLRELVDAQLTGQQLIRSTREQLKQHAPGQQQMDAIAGVVQLQQTIREQLAGASLSLEAQIQEMLQLIDQNQLTNSDLNEHLKQLIKQIREIGAGPAVQAWQLAQKLQAHMISGTNEDVAVLQWQATAQELEAAQENSLMALRGLVDEVDGKESLDKMRQELLDMAADQETLSAATSKFQIDQLTGKAESIEQELADIADRQVALANQLERWVSQAHQQTDGAQSGTSSHEAMVAAAEELLNGQAVSSMQAAGRNLQAKQISQAVEHQQQLKRLFEHAVRKIGAVGSEVSSEVPWQQLNQFGELLLELADNQEELIPQYAQLADQLKQVTGSEEFAGIAKDLLAHQDSVRQELQKAHRIADQLPMFQWVLEQVQQDLDRAIAAIQRRRIQPEAIQAAEDAGQKLRLAAESLSDGDVQLSRLKSESAPSGEDGSEERSEFAAMPPLASLKMARALQLQLQQQISALNEIEDSVFRQRRLAELTQRQHGLAKRMESMLRESDATKPEQPSQSPARRTATAENQPDSSNQATEHPILIVSHEMHAVASILHRGAEFEKAIEMQEQILQQMDQLIEASEQSNSSHFQPQQIQPARSQPAIDPASDLPTGPASNKTNSQRPEDNRQMDPKVTSGKSTSPGELGPVAQSSVKLNDPVRLQQGVWGHLPAQMRSQMESRMVEQFLPSYRERLEDYYRALLQQKSSD